MIRRNGQSTWRRAGDALIGIQGEDSARIVTGLAGSSKQPMDEDCDYWTKTPRTPSGPDARGMD
jgi:hypothetical protein